MDDRDGLAEAGRETVRQRFIARLATSGLKPHGKLTEAQQAEVGKRLVKFLAYLSVPSLDTLADQVLSVAGGKGRDAWPSELVVRQMAEALERRPFEQAPIVADWLSSVEGDRAEAGGYLVQLYRHLRDNPRPPLPYDMTLIKQRAAEDRRREALILEREHLAVEADRVWRMEMAEDLRRAQEIVDRGRARRAQKQQAADAANGEAAA